MSYEPTDSVTIGGRQYRLGLLSLDERASLWEGMHPEPFEAMFEEFRAVDPRIPFKVAVHIKCGVRRKNPDDPHEKVAMQILNSWLMMLRLMIRNGDESLSHDDLMRIVPDTFEPDTHFGECFGAIGTAYSHLIDSGDVVPHNDFDLPEIEAKWRKYDQFVKVSRIFVGLSLDE